MIYQNYIWEREVNFVAEVKRKRNETFDSLWRRFTKRIQQSGRLLQSKKVRYFKRDPNKNSRKKGALRRGRIKVKIDYLKKIGKFDETNLKKNVLR